MDHVNRKARGFTGSSELDPRLLKRLEILWRKLPAFGSSALDVAELALLFLVLVCPEWNVDRDGTFLGNADGCLEVVEAGVRLMRFTKVVLSVEFVFSVDDEVFS